MVTIGDCEYASSCFPMTLVPLSSGEFVPFAVVRYVVDEAHELASKSADARFLPWRSLSRREFARLRGPARARSYLRRRRRADAGYRAIVSWQFNESRLDARCLDLTEKLVEAGLVDRDALVDAEKHLSCCFEEVFGLG